MKKQPPLSLKETFSEHHNCIDCGRNTWPGAPTRQMAEALLALTGEIPLRVTEFCEVYMVRRKIWKQAGMEPWGGCLCIGCLEKRLGRQLTPRDFQKNHPFMRIPGTQRLIDRRGG